MNSPVRWSFLFITTLLALFSLSNPETVLAQLSQGGTPASFTYLSDKQEIPLLTLTPPVLSVLYREDSIAAWEGKPYRYAVNLASHTDVIKEGAWEVLPGGNALCRLRLKAEGALALACSFDRFYLPPGGRLFIYTPDQQQLIGAFTEANNQDDLLFATELMQGDQIIIEYEQSAGSEETPELHLSGLAYAYRGVSFPGKLPESGFGTSGSCEVNVNCSEGQDWLKHKRSVVRISIKAGGDYFWCSGTLLNNTLQNYKPYVLTADHCGAYSSTADLSQWLFYFVYEGPDCDDPAAEPAWKTLTGAKKKASTGSDGSVILESDLYLVLLNNMIPGSYYPYYCGWDRQDLVSNAGVCIHHPQGDIKKISTYNTPTYSYSWSGTPNSHWGVKWSATINGHGVTEPGSSGSALLNAQGKVIGQLSGGGSSCQNLTLPDFYGKFSYSWDAHGGDSTKSLKHWLDPGNTGAFSLDGTGPSTPWVEAAFTVDEDTIITGTSINFTDLSSGNPTSWNWTFDGASPSSSTQQHPASITYSRSGKFNVLLQVSNNSSTDTMLRKRYITVIPNIFPNPFSDKLTLDLGTESSATPELKVYNLLGQEVEFLVSELEPGTRYAIHVKNQRSGMYYLEVKTSGLEYRKKVIYVHH